MSEVYSPSSFISKFYSILKNKNFQAIIRYDETNAKIFIFDKEKLEVQVLPNFFRHNKFTSLIRQLNHYGFKKFKNHSVLTFTHPTLLKGGKFLEIIAKKKAQGLAIKNEEQARNATQLHLAYQFPDYNGVRYEQAMIENNDRRLYTGLSSQGSNSNVQITNSISFLPNFDALYTSPQNSYLINYVFPWQGFYQPNSCLGNFQ